MKASEYTNNWAVTIRAESERELAATRHAYALTPPWRIMKRWRLRSAIRDLELAVS